MKKTAFSLLSLTALLTTGTQQALACFVYPTPLRLNKAGLFARARLSMDKGALYIEDSEGKYTVEFKNKAGEQWCVRMTPKVDLPQAPEVCRSTDKSDSSKNKFKIGPVKAEIKGNVIAITQGGDSSKLEVSTTFGAVIKTVRGVEQQSKKMTATLSEMRSRLASFEIDSYETRLTNGGLHQPLATVLGSPETSSPLNPGNPTREPVSDETHTYADNEIMDFEDKKDKMLGRECDATVLLKENTGDTGPKRLPPTWSRHPD